MAPKPAAPKPAAPKPAAPKPAALKTAAAAAALEKHCRRHSLEVAQLAAVAPAGQPGMADQSGGVCPREALATFCKSADAQAIVRGLEALLTAAGVDRHAEGGALLAPLHAALRPALNYSSGALFTALAARAAQPQYARPAGTRPLQAVVVGAGPIGLRSAVELALQGHAAPVL